MSKWSSVLRNCICAFIALILIAAGFARRGRRRAFQGNVVTSIYFHKPRRRLFVRCVNWMMKHGYTFVSCDDVIRALHERATLPRGAVWLSFDDGWKELRENVLPVVQQYRIPVTMFIPPGIIEGAGQFPWLGCANGVRHALTLDELKELAQLPNVTIGSHTVNHRVTAHSTEEQLQSEIGDSKRILESWTGRPVNCFAYPEGRFDGSEKPVLIEFEYKLAATTENGFVRQNTDAYSTPRIGVADNIYFPEAICNMTGVWRPAIDPLKQFLNRFRRGAQRGRKLLNADGRSRSSPHVGNRAAAVKHGH